MQQLERAPRVVTAGVIAEHVGESYVRVMGVLKRRPHIAPLYRAGNTRLYPPDAIEQVRAELAAIDAKPTAITTGTIAQRLGVSRFRVAHVLRSNPDIRPIDHDGRTRIYGADAVARVRHALNSIDAKRSAQDDDSAPLFGEGGEAA